MISTKRRVSHKDLKSMHAGSSNKYPSLERPGDCLNTKLIISPSLTIAMLNIQVVSRDTIKPSSPTPAELRYLQLSLLDQLAPLVHVAITLYYSGDRSDQTTPARLKKSLSEVLTCFYPLAGRIREDDASGYLHVECNDEGVDFYEVRIGCKLCEFLDHPLPEDLNRIMPYVVSTRVPLVIQLSVFDCGGFAIGHFASHKIMDGNSVTMFIKTWADATREGGHVLKQVSPRFDFSEIFPPRTMKRKLEELSTVPVKLVTKRFVFEVSKIATLREKAGGRVARASSFPTYAEVVSALIWRCGMRSRGDADKERKQIAMQAVDIRRRMEPPLPKNSFGNLWIPSFATGNREMMDYLEMSLRESIEKIKGDYIRHVLENEELTIGGSSWNLFAEEWEKSGFELCAFTSWIAFPFNESDFGWGKPKWLSFGGFPLKNCAALTPARNGGIESWVMMVEQEMRKFEQDPELLEFVSANPSISYNEKLHLLEAKL